MNLFIDLETTSLIPKGADWRTDYNDFPYILSIGLKYRDEKEYFIEEYFVKDVGVDLEGVANINGITNQILKEKGISFKDIMIKEMGWLTSTDLIIGYNVYFDSAIFKANVLRYFGSNSIEAKLIESVLHKDKRIDVMKMVQKRFGGKYMKLTEAYERLFGETYQAHNALQDVLATERIYNALI